MVPLVVQSIDFLWGPPLWVLKHHYRCKEGNILSKIIVLNSFTVKFHEYYSITCIIFAS